MVKPEKTQQRDPRDDKTAPMSRTSREHIGRLVGQAMTLLVYHREGAEVVPLVPTVPVVIGREPPANVIVADSSLSRLHARFLLDARALVVEDLGSTNGTRVRGKVVERAVLRMGEPVALGSVIVSAHAEAPLEPELQALDSHDRFTTALAQALAEARHFGEQLGVVMIRPLGDQPTHVSRWCQQLRARLRPIDRMGLYSDDTVEVLLPRLGAPEVASRAEALRSAGGGRLPELACGIATFPAAGTTVDRLLERCRAALYEATAAAPVACAADGATDGIPVAVDPAMRELFEAVERLSQSIIPVLICGDTGTGKEVVARAIHERSGRRRLPFVCVNCGAIPAQLVESTLFGHVRGAFTGADSASTGVFGAADGGTVLLDEIGELPPAAQTALLRVLESGRMARVGSADEVVVDVRVLAATHRDLELMCDEGRFRRDLLYRLNAVVLSVPPLRERTSEIPLLAERFLQVAMAAARRELAGFSAEAMTALERYRGPATCASSATSSTAPLFSRAPIASSSRICRRVSRRAAIGPSLRSPQPRPTSRTIQISISARACAASRRGRSPTRSVPRAATGRRPPSGSASRSARCFTR